MALSADHEDADVREARFYLALLEGLESVDRGHPIDVDRHAEFAPEIKDFLKTYLWLERLVVPLRAMACAGTGLSRSRVACN
jgi:hypothetical protein